ncbi:MAG: endolytic transglycosylase MltG [Thermodesulfobacteriota bacterium]
MRKSRFEFIAIVITLLGSLLFTHLYVVFCTPLSHKENLKTVSIQKGASFRVVASRLHREGLIRDVDDFLFAAWVLGAYKKSQAGEYEFSSSMAPVRIINMLKRGEIKQYPLTIPEGFNIREIAALLEEKGLARAEDFLSRATDRSFVKEMGFSGRTFEGYLFPDTYNVRKGTSVQAIITKMGERFKAVYHGEFEALAKKRGMTMKEVVTLASIIEKETMAPGERPLISSVFHNRLKKRIRLQSDPTVIYAIKNFDGNLRKRDLRMKSPYNTYRHYGLPPGPISNPGKEALSAAIEPARADYLYFVSRNDGTHQFSKSLKEHTRAVNKYQKSLGGRSPAG